MQSILPVPAFLQTGTTSRVVKSNGFLIHNQFQFLNSEETGIGPREALSKVANQGLSSCSVPALSCRVLKGARWSVLGECVATYSGRPVVARVFIRQQQHSSAKLFS